MRINRKIQRWAAGNWGKPNKTEQKNTNIPIFPEIEKHMGKRKKKKSRPMNPCPFCGAELPRVHKLFSIELRFFSFGISKKCHECGAREIHGCPCCKGMTWFKEGKFKHNKQIYDNCGYQN